MSHTLGDSEPTPLGVLRDVQAPAFTYFQELEQVSGGMTFGALCALLVERYGAAEGPRLAGAWLGQWLCDGLIARVA